MTCGHCAGTIKRAIEGGIIGVKVDADPVRKVVPISGTDDRARVAEIIASAGYAPESTPVG